MARLQLFLSLSLLILLFSCSISATSASTSRPIITTVTSKYPSLTVIEYEEATATSLFAAATSITALGYKGSTSTRLVFIEPSSTQVYQEVAATAEYLDLAPSSTLSIIASAGSIIEVDSLPTATRVYYASASFDAEAAIRVPFNTSTAYNIDATSLDVLCWYPISGSYGRWPRILFYGTLLFALLAEHHEWLIAGALAAALIYSGGAAIHACLLIWRGPGYGELDLHALIPILSSACIIAAPLLNWSSTLRGQEKKKKKKKKDRWLETFHALGIRKVPSFRKVEGSNNQSTRPIILYWSFLVTVGFLCVFFVCIGKDDLPISIVTYSGIDTISCAPPSGKTLNLAAGQNPSWNETIPNQEFISENNCIDPCRGVDPLYDSIFRTSDDLQILTQSQINRLSGVSLSKNELKQIWFIHEYQTYGIVFLPFILAQGIVAVLFGRRDPIQIRDKIYLLLCRSKNRLEVPKWQKLIAKYFALIIFAWAVLIVVICPPLFIFNLVAAELDLSTLPQSETSRHIGSWGPWAATGLVLGAAAVAKFHAPVWKDLRKLPKYSFGLIKQKLQRSQKRQVPDEEKGPSSRSENAPYGKRKQRTSNSAMGIFKKIWLHQKDYFDETHRGLMRFQKNLDDFINLDPDDVALDSDRYGNKRPRLDQPVENVFDTPIGHLNIPLTGDVLVSRPSPLNHDTPSLLNTQYGEGQDRVSRQSSRGRYDMMVNDHFNSLGTSTFSSPSIQDDHSAMMFEDSFSISPHLSHDEDTDYLLHPREENISGEPIQPWERPTTPELEPNVVSPSRPSSAQGFFSCFSEVDLQQITHPLEEERPRTPPITNSFRPSPLSNHSIAQSSPATEREGGRQRSTVSYLQIERPRTMVFEDMITLRKDENGVYRVVEH